MLEIFGGNIFLNALFIFFAKLIEMILDTLRVNFLVKGKRLPMAIMGFVQVMVWITVVREILTGDITLPIMIAYSAGFAVGNVVGVMIENKMALGEITVEAIVEKDETAEILRNEGFGVSEVVCHGKEKDNKLLIIVVIRKRLKELQKLIMEIDSKAFVTVLDTKKVINGYMK